MHCFRVPVYTELRALSGAAWTAERELIRAAADQRCAWAAVLTKPGRRRAIGLITLGLESLANVRIISRNIVVICTAIIIHTQH